MFCSHKKPNGLNASLYVSMYIFFTVPRYERESVLPKQMYLKTQNYPWAYEGATTSALCSGSTD